MWVILATTLFIRYNAEVLQVRGMSVFTDFFFHYMQGKKKTQIK